MDKSEIDKRAESIEIKSDSKREFFLLHGYTGSPTDFHNLSKYLNKRFNANIRIIRLIGHGEKIQNLDKLNYEDFLNQAEKELKKEINKGKEIIIGGISIGGSIALELSAKYPVSGIIAVSIPYKTKFPVNIVSFLEPIILKKYWYKPMSSKEKKLRKNAFFYGMHLRGLRVAKQGKKHLRLILSKIAAPCLIVHVDHDYVFHQKGAEIVKEKISSKIIQYSIFKTEKKARHNPFFSPQHEKLYKIIGDFVEKNKLFKKK